MRMTKDSPSKPASNQQTQRRENGVFDRITTFRAPWEEAQSG